MSTHKTLFIEIGTEELPPMWLKKLADALAAHLLDGLAAAKLSYGKHEVFATPRRLAVRIHQLATHQPDQPINRRGPSLKQAIDTQGNPTPAGLGFARSCGVDFDALGRVQYKNEDCLAYRATQAGQATGQLLPDIINKAVHALPIPKPMRWGARDILFIRPVHWVVLLWDSEVIETTVLGQPTGRYTCGHRFHAPEKIDLQSALTYEKQLADAFVTASFETRRDQIQTQLTELAKQANATLDADPDLLNEVTGLVEYPNALLVDFESDFLTIPAEALIAAMRGHQKSFHLRDQSHRLIAKFITVSNLNSQNPERVIAGNRRVMHARLSDAKFFYELDQKIPLANHLAATKTVVFQEKLGSLYDKAERLSQLATWIAKAIGADQSAAARAGLLADCDLLTQMVGEFPELQGTMGFYYAAQSGEPEAVAIALQERYLPKFATDALPETQVGRGLAIAARMDRLFGSIAIGQKPTGDKDPFGLRRAALGIIRILVEQQITLDLKVLIHQSRLTYQTLSIGTADTETAVYAYLLDRLHHWYLEQGFRPQMITAVTAHHPTDWYDVDRRLKAVAEFDRLDVAAALAAANKRVSHLLAKTDAAIETTEINEALFQRPEEQRLVTEIAEKQSAVTPLYERGHYTEALQVLATLKDPVDAYFDKVMVMADDPKLRLNRLATLSQLRALFLGVADISLL